MVIDSYIKAFGVMNDEAFDPIIEKRTFDIIENNRAAIIALLYVYPKKFDRGSERNVEKKVEALKNA